MSVSSTQNNSVKTLVFCSIAICLLSTFFNAYFIYFGTKRTIVLEDSINTLKQSIYKLQLHLNSVHVTPLNIERIKRDIVGYTSDGVPINSESYLEFSTRNYHGNRRAKYENRTNQPMLQYANSRSFSNPHRDRGSTTPMNRITATYGRGPSVTLTPSYDHDHRRYTFEKSSSPSPLTESTPKKEQPHMHHNRHMGHINQFDIGDFSKTTPGSIITKPTSAVHFSGDTSKYTLGRHSNFNGNGHIRHLQKTFVDWTQSEWVHSLGMDKYFTMNNGHLVIKESGLYFIYAQIYYLDEHDINGYRVYKNNQSLLQCTVMVHSNERIKKGNTCYTAGIEYINKNDHISLRDLSEARYSIFEPSKSFFGLIKLMDG